MSNKFEDFVTPKDRFMLNKFIGVLQKRGNRARAIRILIDILSQIKAGIRGTSNFSKYPLKTLNQIDPVRVLDRSLYTLKPAFLLRPIVKSGKRYDLPVPVSEKRALFMAMDWLRKAAFKNNKNNLSFSHLITQEISSSIYKDGLAYSFLKNHIEIGIDQRPFSRFIKKKRSFLSKLNRRRRPKRMITRRFEKLARKRYRVKRIRRYRIYKLRNFLNNRKLSKMEIKRKKNIYITYAKKVAKPLKKKKNYGKKKR